MWPEYGRVDIFMWKSNPGWENTFQLYRTDHRGTSENKVDSYSLAGILLCPCKKRSKEEQRKELPQQAEVCTTELLLKTCVGIGFFEYFHIILYLSNKSKQGLSFWRFSVVRV